MSKLEQAARQALDALAESHDNVIDCFNVATNNGATRLQEIYKDQLNKHEKAVTALREALAHSGEANETGFEKVKLNPEYDLGIGRWSMTINRWVDDGKLGITGVKHDLDKIFTPKEQRLVAEQALQKLSDFHQSIEHDGHWSDCSTHNEPAYPNGECDCGGYPAGQVSECKYKEAYIIWQDKTEWVQETAHPKELGMHRADVLRQRIENLKNAATHPVRTKDLTDDEVWKIYGITGLGKGMALRFARAVIAADREKNKCQH